VVELPVASRPSCAAVAAICVCVCDTHVCAAGPVWLPCRSVIVAHGGGMSASLCRPPFCSWMTTFVFAPLTSSLLQKQWALPVSARWRTNGYPSANGCRDSAGMGLIDQSYVCSSPCALRYADARTVKFAVLPNESMREIVDDSETLRDAAQRALGSSTPLPQKFTFALDKDGTHVRLDRPAKNYRGETLLLLLRDDDEEQWSLLSVLHRGFLDAIGLGESCRECARGERKFTF